MIYLLLKTFSNAFLTFFTTILRIQDGLINLMMSCCLLLLQLACHPIMLLPMLLGGAYWLREMMMRPKTLSMKFGKTLMSPQAPSCRSNRTTPNKDTPSGNAE